MYPLERFKSLNYSGQYCRLSLQLSTISRGLVSFSFYATRLAMKYASLIAAQKRSIVEEATRRNSFNEPVTSRIVAAWCQKKFDLASSPGKSAVARILKGVRFVASPDPNIRIIKKFRARHEANP